MYARCEGQIQLAHLNKYRESMEGHAAAQWRQYEDDRFSQFNSIQFNSIQFNSIQFNSIQIKVKSSQVKSSHVKSSQVKSIQVKYHQSANQTSSHADSRTVRVTAADVRV